MYNKKPTPKYKLGDVVVIARCAVDDCVGKHGYIKEINYYADGYATYVVKFFLSPTPEGFVEECLEIVT